jgi:hypothetical protein
VRIFDIFNDFSSKIAKKAKKWLFSSLVTGPINFENNGHISRQK